ncbi:hypothetical protein CLV92_11352 [Kineococcus xinjiangensis]|uniref:Peptidoglycan binding protein n=1 Tax=Kineococcus xinjiangensis TaxID=512762 RepID=A0A2S6IEK3_9ACTN|nr:hypothetical protein [Kineococcus xinjiangensis]PPK92623.1 hypothetical protein CLV92_11352 [Kineococcus xinjiangensis]
MTLPRRSFLGLVTTSPVLALPPQAAGARAPAVPAQQAGTAVVDMEAVVKAAQWDPAKSGTGTVVGAGPSVRLVEAALRDRGLLEPGYVNGHFGTRTLAAYATWQERLGFTGLAATGLPGRASLARLGEGRFTLSRVISPGTRTTHQGFPVGTRTLAMLRAAQSRCGLTFTVEQGSYSPAIDPTSAGTHDGGGALDLDAERIPAARRGAAVTALREVGFAAWLRTPAQGNWPLHIHAVAISDTDLSTPAQKQVGAYYEGRDGLANAQPDDGPRVPRTTYEEYLRR